MTDSLPIGPVESDRRFSASQGVDAPVSFLVPSTEQPAEEEEEEQERQECSIFPFDYCVICPLPCQTLLPQTFHDVKDCTHLMLILGTFASVLLVCSAAFTIVNGNVGCTTDDAWCVASQFGAAPLTLIFALSVALYCNRVIRQYDGALQAKRQLVKDQKENLVKRYQGLLSDMETLLNKSSESATGLAERSFESKRRDFARFLERAKTRFISDGDDDVELLEHFRRFCVHWLSVFKECSIDPVNHPRIVVSHQELMQCQSMTEMANLCLERLRATEVRFVSSQRDQDAKMIDKSKSNLKRLVVNQQANQMALMNEPAGLGGGPDMMVVPTVLDPAAAQREREQRRQSWLRFGKYGLRWKQGRGADRYPKEFCFGCGRLILLSREHLQLIIQFFFGLVLITFEIIAAMEKFTVDDGLDHYYFYAVCTALALTQTCIVVLLLKFEELDIIQQMEREVRELEKQSTAVETQRQKMTEFWASAQQLTDLWLYRTVPRLDLFKELHSQLEDGSPGDLIPNIVGVNAVLTNLDANLGKIENWRNDGDIDIEDKKAFGREINQLCHGQEFEELIVQIGEVAQGKVLKRMKALGPAPAKSNQPRMSIR